MQAVSPESRHQAVWTLESTTCSQGRDSLCLVRGQKGMWVLEPQVRVRWRPLLWGNDLGQTLSEFLVSYHSCSDFQNIRALIKPRGQSSTVTSVMSQRCLEAQQQSITRDSSLETKKPRESSDSLRPWEREKQKNRENAQRNGQIVSQIL